MNIDRRKKIQRACRKLIDTFLQQDIPDNENIFWIINIGEIILSPDSSYLDIHVSSFYKPDVLTKTLAKYAFLLQKDIWKQIGLRRSPKVRFRYDESWAISTDVTNTINSI